MEDESRGRFTNFTVTAFRSDGTLVNFQIFEHDKTARPLVGYTHDEALQAETELYNRLVKVFQGEDEN